MLQPPLVDRLACPVCGGALTAATHELTCSGCGRAYPMRPHLDLLAAVRRPPNEGPGDSATMAYRRRAWEQRAMRRDSGERRAIAHYLDTVVPHLRPGAVALDLGCGTGLVLRELGRRVTGPLVLAGLDISKPMLNAAYQTIRGEPRATVFRASSRRRLPFRDAVCAVVLRRLAPALPDEVLRVLAPGGAYISASFGPQHWRELYDMVPDLPRPRQRTGTTVDDLLAAGFARAEPHAWRADESVPATEALERILLGPAGFHVDWERDLPRLRRQIAAAGDLLRLTTDVQVVVAVKAGYATHPPTA